MEMEGRYDEYENHSDEQLQMMETELQKRLDSYQIDFKDNEDQMSSTVRADIENIETTLSI